MTTTDTRPHPLTEIAGHGNLGHAAADVLLGTGNPLVLQRLAGNPALTTDVRDLVLADAMTPGRQSPPTGAHPLAILARNASITPTQRATIAADPNLRVEVLAALAAGGPDDGVAGQVADHLARLEAAAARKANDQSRRTVGGARPTIDPVVRAVAIGAGWDRFRERAIRLLDDVADVLANLSHDDTGLPIGDVVAGAPFRPASFADGMEALLRWPEAADLVEPANLEGLVAIAAVCADASVHRRALAEARRRLDNRRAVDAERLAESVATNPAVRLTELTELTKLRSELPGGYLHAWFPVEGAGARADQLSPAAAQRVLRTIRNRPQLGRRGVWTAAAIALHTTDQDVLVEALDLVASNRFEGPQRQTLEWVERTLGLHPGRVVAPQTGARRSGAAELPSDVARRDADALVFRLGDQRAAWVALEALTRDHPGRDPLALADIALAITGAPSQSAVGGPA